MSGTSHLSSHSLTQDFLKTFDQIQPQIAHIRLGSSPLGCQKKVPQAIEAVGHMLAFLFSKIASAWVHRDGRKLIGVTGYSVRILIEKRWVAGGADPRFRPLV